jgi:hypothetical protein
VGYLQLSTILKKIVINLAFISLLEKLVKTVVGSVAKTKLILNLTSRRARKLRNSRKSRKVKKARKARKLRKVKKLKKLRKVKKITIRKNLKKKNYLNKLIR